MTRSRLPLAAVLAAAALVPACGPKPPQYKAETGDAVAEKDPWARVAAPLRKDSEVTACRQVLTQLNNDLSNNGEAALQPASLDPAADKPLRELLGLTDAEVGHVRPGVYSGLDPHYLAECLYLADVAKSLDLGGLPPARQAEQAFAWVCRQVVLHPAVLMLEQPIVVAAPPVAVLRRGAGSGLERALVLVALVRQLGLDGCLVGGPDAWKEPASAVVTDPQAVPRGPFWAVGVRAGADVLLFDPWRGEPLPGPNGQGVATLAQVKANPDQLKPWADDKARPWAVPADALKAATPHLTAPLSGLAPRFARLERELKATLPVRLVVDPVALRARFAAEAKLPDLKFWNPAGEAFSGTRTLGSFVPAEDGGFEARRGVFQVHLRDQLPPALFQPPPELVGFEEAKNKVRDMAINAFGLSFLSPPMPREQLQRGQFAEATAGLVERRKAYANVQSRLRSDISSREQEIKEFVEKGNEAYRGLARARGQNNPVALAEAQAGVERFWKEQGRAASIFVELAVADAGHAEATFQLALSMHEQAERAQSKLDRAKPADADKARLKAAGAWAEARDWWKRYEPVSAAQDEIYPGRAAHARRLGEYAAARAVGLGAR